MTTNHNDKFIEDRYNKPKFQLNKILKYITLSRAEVIYKQMILPLFDYAGFTIESSGKTTKLSRKVTRKGCNVYR